MNYEEMIYYIEEEEFLVLNNLYYHAFQYKQEDFINMITKGIKSPILLGKMGNGNNGPFYVSLSKNENGEKSIHQILNSLPMFVINDKLKTVKAKNASTLPIWFTRSPLPFRECEYDDEYQRFLRVSPKNILAIQYNLFSIYQKNNDDDYIKYKLLVLQKIVEDLYSQNIDLPIIDASTSTKINKEKVLSLKI